MFFSLCHLFIESSLDKSHKRKKKQHKSKKDHLDAPPLPPSDGQQVPPPPPPDDPSTLPLPQSPPPVMPTILRQGSRSRVNTIEQTLPRPMENEDSAAKQFEEQLALLDGNSSKLNLNHWEQTTSGSEEDEQVERICRMNNTTTIAGPIQFKLIRSQTLPLKTSPVSNEILTNDDDIDTPMNLNKKKRLHKPEESLINPSEDDSQVKKAKLTETPTISTNEEPIKVVEEVPVTTSSTTNEKKLIETDRHSRSSSDSSSRRRNRRRRRRRHSSYRRHRHRRHSSSSTSRSSSSSTSSDSSRSSSSRSSSRSSSTSSDRHRRHHRRRRRSRSSSRSYSRHRSSTSRSSYSSSSSRSSRSRSRSRRKSSRNHPHPSNQKGRGGNLRRGGGGRGMVNGRNAGVRRRPPSNDNSRRPTPNRNGLKYNPNLATNMRKLPGNKPPRVLIAATPKINEEISNETNTNISSTTGNEEIKSETIILTTNSNQNRGMGQKKSKTME